MESAKTKTKRNMTQMQRETRRMKMKTKVKMTAMIKKNTKLEKRNRRDSKIQKYLQVTTVLSSQWSTEKLQINQKIY